MEATTHHGGYSASTVIRPTRWCVVIGSGPVDDRLGAVLVRRQQRQVDDAPGGLRLHAGHRPAAEHLNHGGAAADGRHRPLVLVLEGLRLLAGDPVRDRLARVLSRLERDRAELRQHLLGLRVGDRRDVADHVDLRMTGE